MIASHVHELGNYAIIYNICNLHRKEGHPMITKERIDETNIIRGIACLAVVLVHITAGPVATLNPGSIHSIIFTILNRGSRFTTPTFIFLSGLTLFYSYEERDFKYGRFLKRRFSATLIPYGIWSIVYFLYFYSKGIYSLSPKLFLENILLAKMSYHLYFILTITQFYILFGIFLYGYRRFNSHILLITSLIANLLFLKYRTMPYFSMSYADRFFMTYIFFFSVGCYVAKNLSAIKKGVVKLRYLLLISYISIVLYDSYLFYQYYIFQKPVDNFTVLLIWVIFATIAIGLLMALAINVLEKHKKVTNVLKTISKSSYYVYLSHPLILILSDNWLIERGIYSITGRAILNVIIVYSITLSLSIGYTKVKDNIKNRTNMLNKRVSKQS